MPRIAETQVETMTAGEWRSKVEQVTGEYRPATETEQSSPFDPPEGER